MDAINDKLGPLLSRIGEEGARIAGGKADGLFIYAEMHKGHPDVIVFRDRGKTVKGFAETDALHDLVAQAWALNPPRRRWVVMAYSVDGRKFDAQLLYPDQVDLKKPLKDRLLPLFPKRFDGKKLVIDRKPRPSAEPDAGEGTDWKSSEDYSKT